jgi:hypothetical protein
MSTVALVIRSEKGSPSLIDVLFEDHEIESIDKALRFGTRNPLTAIYQKRAEQIRKDEEFGDYVESLLTRSFPNSEVRNHCVQWLHSKQKIEEFLKTEREAAETIAEYALKVFQSNPSSKDFMLKSMTSCVRIRIFEISGT